LTLALCLFVGIPAAIALTPEQDLVSLGQPLSVGARVPSPTISGPAQVVQIGNTVLDIPKLNVYGPLRPKLVIGPVRRTAEAEEALRPETARQAGRDAENALIGGFLRWYGWASLTLLGLTVVICAVAGYARILFVLRGQIRACFARGTAVEIWRRNLRSIRRTGLLAVLAVTLAWVASGALAYQGAMQGLRSVHSLADLVGTYHVSPSPIGPPRVGYAGAVIGDSRAARLGGPPLPDATVEDRVCQRSIDSLAAELSTLMNEKVLNLACPSATIAAGVRGAQQRGGELVPPQLGQLKQVQNLKFVAVAVGPNDIGWADFLGYCYGARNCSDNLSQGEFDYRLAAFDRNYGALLQDLAELPGRPSIVIVTSYRVLDPNAMCPDIHGPLPVPGLNPAKIELLNERNDQLNAVLTNGAAKYGFAVADPALGLLCQHPPDGLGADLQKISDPYPFHPTGIGSLRMAASVLRQVTPPPQ
jgi:hypothetical protein